MSSLEDFEKALAAEKAESRRSERDREERHRHKHQHHRSHRDHEDRSERRRDEREERGEGHRDHRDGSRERERHRKRREDDEGDHRSKRSRHHRDEDRRGGDRPSRRHHERDEAHRKGGDQKEDLPIPDDEKPREEDAVDEARRVTRDDWMMAPSAMDIDYVQRRKTEAPKPREEPKKVVPKNLIHVEPAGDNEQKEREITYTIGDNGSKWRMTKLRGVYTAAEERGCPVDEVVLERFASFEEFDEAREEEDELAKRKLYGAGYAVKEKPTGELHRARMAEAAGNAPERETAAEPEQGKVVPDEAVRNAPAAIMDQTALNRLRATMMKAKLRKSPDAARLEAEYNAAAAAFAQARDPEAVVLGVMHNRELAGARGEVKAVTNRRGRARGHVEANEDMSIEDMVREEKRTRHNPGGEGLRLAERIAKDGKFGDDLEYMDENAEKLARRVHKSEANLKNTAVSEFQKVNRILDSCPLCHHEDEGRGPVAPVVSLATRVFLTLPTEPEVSPGGAVIVPLAHRANLLECDDDEWEEMRNFMKSLVRMYHDKGQEVVFYENAAHPARRGHAAMVAAPIPYAEGATAPAYFREAFLTSDEEWSQHRKIIDTGRNATAGGMGRMAFRRSIAKEMPYFHVWFTLDGGLGHVVEDAGRWPRGDGFAREVLGGIVGADAQVIKKQGRWVRGDKRVEGFKREWNRFDWTRVLAEG